MVITISDEPKVTSQAVSNNQMCLTKVSPSFHTFSNIAEPHYFGASGSGIENFRLTQLAAKFFFSEVTVFIYLFIRAVFQQQPRFCR
jgi:uncharacterized membrane protein (GlpM family)